MLQSTRNSFIVFDFNGFSFFKIIPYIQNNIKTTFSALLFNNFEFLAIGYNTSTFLLLKYI